MPLTSYMEEPNPMPVYKANPKPMAVAFYEADPKQIPMTSYMEEPNPRPTLNQWPWLLRRLILSKVAIYMTDPKPMLWPAPRLTLSQCLWPGLLEVVAVLVEVWCSLCYDHV